LQAQQTADQVFWLLGTAVPELLAPFTGRPQPTHTNLSEIISTLRCERPAPIVLIC